MQDPEDFEALITSLLDRYDGDRHVAGGSVAMQLPVSGDPVPIDDAAITQEIRDQLAVLARAGKMLDEADGSDADSRCGRVLYMVAGNTLIATRARLFELYTSCGIASGLTADEGFLLLECVAARRQGRTTH